MALHFKDFHPGVGKQVAENGCDYFQAVRQGVFCELGKGEVDFPSLMKELEKLDYDGWGVVEQDVLPGMGKPKEIGQTESRVYPLARVLI